ncbi:MAG: hypothetical protein Ct9H300mP15_21200 [Gemmatimonadota bacterium]|nr:MAG: hypothetical protein Ct9H300mP15_21200 [Gemmatimonadota bacterium]
MAEKIIGTDIAPQDLLQRSQVVRNMRRFQSRWYGVCQVVIEPHAHARVRGVDATRALAMPGV